MPRLRQIAYAYAYAYAYGLNTGDPWGYSRVVSRGQLVTLTKLWLCSDPYDRQATIAYELRS